MGQPGGLPEGSRKSPGVWGRRPPDNSVGDFMHPGRGARLVAAATRAGDGLAGKGWVWHPSGVLRYPTRFSGGRSPLCPERPPATIYQPSRVGSRVGWGVQQKMSKLQTPARMPALPVVHGEGAHFSSSVHPEPGVRLRSSAARLRTFVATFIATFVEKWPVRQRWRQRLRQSHGLGQLLEWAHKIQRFNCLTSNYRPGKMRPQTRSTGH